MAVLHVTALATYEYPVLNYAPVIHYYSPLDAGDISFVIKAISCLSSIYKCMEIRIHLMSTSGVIWKSVVPQASAYLIL
jgi:hypothetical protein